MNKQISIFNGVVLKDKKVLMVLRHEPECKEAHMKWELPGGKCDFGETPEESVIREVKEEAGVEAQIVSIIPHIQTIYWDYAWGKQQTLCHSYICKFIGEIPHKQDHHVVEVRWFSIDEALRLDLLAGTDILLKEAKKYVQG